MQIAVASGKGGTGKTTVATSLARSLANLHETWYVDCDVEAPNGHLFLNPRIDQQSQAVIQIPQIQQELCTACGKCVEVCQFHALAKIGRKILVFPQLCHGCGSCTWNCPEGAIVEVANSIGLLESGMTGEGIHFLQGVLRISEPMATPIIRQLKQHLPLSSDSVVIRDAPPGASCSVVETLRGADIVLLVTEPTPFGVHDLKQMIGIVHEMGLPAGVVINRETEPYNPLNELCTQNNLPVWMRIPYDRTIAEGIAAGRTLEQIYPTYRHSFQQLFEKIKLLMSESTSR